MEALIPIFLFVSIATVAILRPISTKLGTLIEAMAREKQGLASSAGDADLARMRVLLEHVAKRMDLLEERLDFTERLLNSSQSGLSGMLRADAPRRETGGEFRAG
jgi:hypothetical protein